MLVIPVGVYVALHDAAFLLVLCWQSHKQIHCIKEKFTLFPPNSV